MHILLVSCVWPWFPVCVFIPIVFCVCSSGFLCMYSNGSLCVLYNDFLYYSGFLCVLKWFSVPVVFLCVLICVHLPLPFNSLLSPDCTSVYFSLKLQYHPGASGQWFWSQDNGTCLLFSSSSPLLQHLMSHEVQLYIQSTPHSWHWLLTLSSLGSPNFPAEKLQCGSSTGLNGHMHPGCGWAALLGGPSQPALALLLFVLWSCPQHWWTQNHWPYTAPEPWWHE